MGEKRKRTPFDPEARHRPCPVCGSESFTWGRPTSSGGVYFTSEGLWPVAYQKGLRARECDACGNVLIFTKHPTDKEVV